MTDPKQPFQFDAETYREFERKMILFEEGPTTTPFEQLAEAGIELPPPDAIAPADIRPKLWEILAALAARRMYLDKTDHLNDAELYGKLWNGILREEVPAIDEIGFSHYVDVINCIDDEEIYLKYYADDDWRKRCVEESPDCPMPAHEEPPYNRDWLVPRPQDERGPEAREWLKANPSPHAFASNRFQTTADALRFVERLYELGATEVIVDNIMFLQRDNWLPYADTFIVFPPDGVARQRLFEFVEKDGAPE